MIFQLQAAGGINRYFANVISRLPDDFSPTVVVDHVRNLNYPLHPKLKRYQLGKVRFQTLSYRLGMYCSRLEDMLVKRRLAFQSFDVFHPTYYTRLTDTAINAALVITVWDMIH